ncbi:MAG: DASS family sodium-coupled anion symporter [Acidobacteriota bacterium]
MTSPGTQTRPARPGLVLLWCVLAVFVYALLPADQLSHAGRSVASVGVLMAALWLSEAIPLPATALLPLALIPTLTGGEISIRSVAAPYGHELIFLFMGGFMIALAMQSCGLHRRIALRTILTVGSKPHVVVLGFMLAAAGLSMWISNTATAVMMLPIALSVIELLRAQTRAAEGESFPFATCLLLGTAYACSIGGMATLIGTPPNLMMAAFLEDSYGMSLGMGEWLPFGLGITCLLLPAAWLLLVKLLFPLEVEEIPGGDRLFREKLEEQGSASTAERRVLAVFGFTALLWISRSWLQDVSFGGSTPFAGLSDSGIAMTAAILLFALPNGCDGKALLLWSKARELPWGILLLFGGGLSLAAAVRASGVDRFLGGLVGSLSGVSLWVLVAGVTALVVFMTELTSNAATTATLLPILAAAAEGLGVEPLVLVVPATLAASCAFMMPVATPPNAIVFGSGELSIRQMCKAGIWLNLLAIAVIVAVTMLLGPSLLGMES